jgi:hypothetical protein
MDSDASPPLAARVSALLSAPLLSALLLLLRQSACACSVSGVTASTSRDGDGGMDVEDGDSDAGASEIVCSPGSGRMRSGLICQHVKPVLKQAESLGRTSCSQLLRTMDPSEARAPSVHPEKRSPTVGGFSDENQDYIEPIFNDGRTDFSLKRIEESELKVY